MPFEPGSLTVRRVDANTWSQVDERLYRGRRERFVVPAGFRTHSATVPWVVTWLAPRFGAYTLAAVRLAGRAPGVLAAGALTGCAVPRSGPQWRT